MSFEAKDHEEIARELHSHCRKLLAGVVDGHSLLQTIQAQFKPQEISGQVWELARPLEGRSEPSWHVIAREPIVADHLEECLGMNGIGATKYTSRVSEDLAASVASINLQIDPFSIFTRQPRPRGGGFVHSAEQAFISFAREVQLQNLVVRKELSTEFVYFLSNPDLAIAFGRSLLCGLLRQVKASHLLEFRDGEESKPLVFGDNSKGALYYEAQPILAGMEDFVVVQPGRADIRDYLHARNQNKVIRYIQTTLEQFLASDGGVERVNEQVLHWSQVARTNDANSEIAETFVVWLEQLAKTETGHN